MKYSQTGYPGLTAQDQAGSTTTDKAVYVLLSHGMNGHGAYLPSGQRLAANVTNTSEQENCDCDSTAADATPDHIFVSGTYTETAGDITNRFDDLVTLAVREQVRDRYDETGATPPDHWGCQPTFVRFDGETANDLIGSALASGDINGDGIKDIVLAGPADHGANWSSIYVVYGKSMGWTSPINVGTLNGSNGFRIDGLFGAGWFFGGATAAADVNGDGRDDVIIGHAIYDRVYVVFGAASPGPATFDLASLNGANGFFLHDNNDLGYWGAFSPHFGASVAARDVNGDGAADLLIGAWATNIGGFPVNEGSATLVMGLTGVGAAACLDGSAPPCPASYTVDATFVNGTRAVRFKGYGGNQWFGSSTAIADVNNDGNQDFLIGAMNGTQVKVIYGVGGAWPWWGASFDLSTIDDTTNGFTLSTGSLGPVESLDAGVDINKDGFKDIVLPTGAGGLTTVVFGGAGPPMPGAPFDVTTVDGTTGFTITDGGGA